MNVIKQFDVEIFGLHDGFHEYSHEINDVFFQYFKESLIEKGSLKCKIILNKSERLIAVDFRIKGVLELICDRSLECFDYNIDINEQVIFKYGEDEMELENNIYVITGSTQRLRLGQIIYELITVAIPMRKLHPRFAEEDLERDDGLYYSSYEKSGTDRSQNKTDRDSTDPRWDALKKLRDNLK